MSSAAQDTITNAAIESQSTVEAGSLGFSNATSVKTIFAASPIHKGELKNTEDVYFNGGTLGTGDIEGLNGTVSSGYGFSEDVDLNYPSAPDMKISPTVTGPPANAYVPNPSSPGGVIGVPSDNPNHGQPSPATFTTMNGFGGTAGGGPSMIDADGLPITPRASSANISTSAKNGTLGKSVWTAEQKIDSKTSSPGVGRTD